MTKKKKVTVWIEEHLTKSVKMSIETSEDWTEQYTRQVIEERARESYYNGDIILSADDFNGDVMMRIEVDGKDSEGWFDL